MAVKAVQASSNILQLMKLYNITPEIHESLWNFQRPQPSDPGQTAVQGPLSRCLAHLRLGPQDQEPTL